MKLLRIELRNYRGIAERQVEFAPTGVTIVEGPNEIGKSSIAEAVDHVLEDLDSTSKQSVVAIRPVGQDVGPEVAIEVETGPYAFRLRKRFLKGSRTELEILQPSHEQVTGREAHERVRAMLAETVDLGLWKALRIQQGAGVDQAALTNQASLSAALDRAAGEAPAGEEERSLFTLAHTEYLQYWTETGRRKLDAGALPRAVDSALEEVAATDTALAQIEADVEASVRHQAEVLQLIEQRGQHAERVTEYEERLRRLTKLEADVEATQARRDAAAAAANEARRHEGARAKAVADLIAAAAERDRLAAERNAAGLPIEAAEARLATAEAAVVSARTSRDKAQRHASNCRADLSFRRDERDLTRLQERKARVDAALAALQSAETTLATNHVDLAALDAIKKSHLAVERGRARLEASRPTLTVEALAATEGQLDGISFHLAAGERLERLVEESLRLTVPGVLTLSVAARPGADPALAKLRAEETSLAELCQRAGAVDAADAERLHGARLQAERIRVEQKRVLGDNLQRLTSEGLEGELVALRTRVATFTADRTTEPGMAADEEQARAAAEEAERALASAEQPLAAADHEAESARKQLGDLRGAETESAVALRLAEDRLERLGVALASDRAAETDDALARRQAETVTVEERLDGELQAARDELDREGPDRVRTMLANAKETLAVADRELRNVQDALLEVQTRLRDHGEDGLAEKRDAALSALAVAERNWDRYQMRAAARKLLYETMHTERETSRRAYVAPLRQQIENLGSYVFGGDFAVKLDDDLRILNRTLRGETIPFGSLSMGAQEQLGLIARFACAMIVAPDGGVPLILDDALGNSDPQRLEAMGAVLSVTGRQCQIIVLTSQPGRYQHVGGATIVRLM